MLKMMTRIGTILGLLALPVLANATLTTFNNTDFDSTVKVTSNSHKWCAAKVPPLYKYTPRHGKSTASLLEVRALCGALSGPCTADIYLNLDCTGSPIATVRIDIASQNVIDRTPLDNNYKVTWQGSTVSIDKATVAKK
jgi:hypothetical protein